MCHWLIFNVIGGMGNPEGDRENEEIEVLSSGRPTQRMIDAFMLIFFRFPLIFSLSHCILCIIMAAYPKIWDICCAYTISDSLPASQRSTQSACTLADGTPTRIRMWTWMWMWMWMWMRMWMRMRTRTPVRTSVRTTNLLVQKLSATYLHIYARWAVPNFG